MGEGRGQSRSLSVEDVDDALHTLHGRIELVGRARADAVRTEHMVRVERSFALLGSARTNAQLREAEALTSDRYLAAVNAHAEAVGRFEAEIARRKACEMTIEAWRSMNANLRAARL